MASRHTGSQFIFSAACWEILEHDASEKQAISLIKYLILCMQYASGTLIVKRLDTQITNVIESNI